MATTQYAQAFTNMITAFYKGEDLSPHFSTDAKIFLFNKHVELAEWQEWSTKISKAFDKLSFVPAILTANNEGKGMCAGYMKGVHSKDVFKTADVLQPPVAMRWLLTSIFHLHPTETNKICNITISMDRYNLFLKTKVYQESFATEETLKSYYDADIYDAQPYIDAPNATIQQQNMENASVFSEKITELVNSTHELWDKCVAKDFILHTSTKDLNYDNFQGVVQGESTANGLQYITNETLAIGNFVALFQTMKMDNPVNTSDLKVISQNFVKIIQFNDQSKMIHQWNAGDQISLIESYFGSTIGDESERKTQSRFPSNPDAITTEFLQKIILQDNNTTIKDFKLSGIGEIHGYAACSTFIHITYDPPNDKLPKRLFAKFSLDYKNPMRAALVTLHAYKREFLMYTKYLPIMNVNMPKIYYADFDEETHESLVVMEDLAVKMHVGDQAAGASINQVNDVLREIAKFHAHFLKSAEIEDEQFMKLFAAPVDKTTLLQAFKRSSIDMFIDYFGDKLNEVHKQRLDSLEAFCAKQLVGDELGAKSPFKSLAHGDFRLDNLFLKNEDSDAPAVILIDYQIPHVTGCLDEVANFIGASAQPDDFVNCYDSCWEVYAEEVAKHNSKVTKQELIDQKAVVAKQFLLVAVMQSAGMQATVKSGVSLEARVTKMIMKYATIATNLLAVESIWA